MCACKITSPRVVVMMRATLVNYYRINCIAELKMYELEWHYYKQCCKGLYTDW